MREQSIFNHTIMKLMSAKRIYLPFLISMIALLSVACVPQEEAITLPTIAVLASVTPTSTLAPFTPTDLPTESPTDAPTESPTDEPTETDIPTDEPAITDEPTTSPTTEPTVEATPEGGFATFTASATLNVTYTPAPSRTATPLPTDAPQGFELLALLSSQFTVLPPELRYNAPTLTALANAVNFQIANPDGGLGATATAVFQQAPIETQVAVAPIVCGVPAPTSISNVLSSEPHLLNGLGCSIGGNVQLVAAIQNFERGSMIYVSGAPGDIYVLFSDGRYRKFSDTWVENVDPSSGGEIPPTGLTEPIRGFGKVWRINLDVRNGIGWATTGEDGATATLLYFERGRAIYLPQRNESIILIEDSAGAASGTWRSVIGAF